MEPCAVKTVPWNEWNELWGAHTGFVLFGHRLSGTANALVELVCERILEERKVVFLGAEVPPTISPLVP
jgi:hypothetical protein